MLSHRIAFERPVAPRAEHLSVFGDAASAGLQQAVRGLGLALLGFGVVLSVAAVLIGVTELGAGAAGPPLPPEQVLTR